MFVCDRYNNLGAKPVQGLGPNEGGAALAADGPGSLAGTAMNERTAKLNVRHDQIMQYLRGHGNASVQDLADEFQVSVMTVRRDLMLLEESGRITRTHGGAILSKPGVVEFTFLDREQHHAPEKQAIAAAVASLIPPGSTVALDSGTTTLEVAKAIAGIEGLTVLTSSLAIASVLYTHETITMVLLGGVCRKGSPDLTGWLIEQNLKQFHVDYAIVGADGLTCDGAFTKAVDVSRVCQAVLAAGACSILVADHSKIGRASFSRYADVKDFDHIVTDAGVPAAERRWLSREAKDVAYVKV